MTPDTLLYALQTAAWNSDAFYVAMAWTIGVVGWLVAFLAGTVLYVLDGGRKMELILVAPLWGFLCLMGAIILGAGWPFWLGLAALVACVAFIYKATGTLHKQSC